MSNNQFSFEFVGIALSSSGAVSFILAAAVAVILIAVAWKIARMG